MAVATVLILSLEQGSTFNHDQVDVVLSAPDLSLREVFEPRDGHLGATTTVVYKALLEAFGSGDVSFRILHVVFVLLAAAAFYALVKRRIGALPALAPTLILLFLGADWAHVVTPPGFTVMFSVAAGLGALLALERDDRLGDATACLLVTASTLTFSTGLAFLAGVAISVLLRSDRWRRAWIFAVPAILYLAWWLWALSWDASSGGQVELSNALLIPAWVFQSLGAVFSALAGIAHDFQDDGGRPEINASGGAVLALVAIIALAVRIRRGSVPPMLWVTLGIALVYWALQALASGPDFRYPSKFGYMYPGAVFVLLALATALAATRFTRRASAVVLVVTAFSLAVNVAAMRDGADWFREGSAAVGAQFAMLELARPQIDDPGLDPFQVTPEAVAETPAGPYFAFVDEYGSPAPSLGELRDQDESVRARADQILAATLGLHLEPATVDARAADCKRRRGAGASAPIEFLIPAGGASVRSDNLAFLTLGRFAAAPTVELGELPAGGPAAVRIAADAASTPWRAQVSGASSVSVCPLS